MSTPSYKLTKDQQEKTKKIFASLDSDKSGYIEVRELGPVVKLLGTLNISIDQKSLEAVVGKFDKGKKRLNQEQFSQMLLYLLELKNNAPDTSAKLVISASTTKPQATTTTTTTTTKTHTSPTPTRSPSSSSVTTTRTTTTTHSPSSPPPSTGRSRFKAPLRQLKKTFFNYHKQLNSALSKEKSEPQSTITVSVATHKDTPRATPKHTTPTASPSSSSSSSAAPAGSYKPTFVDDSFPANNSVLPKHAVGKVVAWKRPHEMSERPSLFVDGAEEGDVQQGCLGDCWFVGALAVLATSGNDFIEHSFIKADMKKGEYQCKFCKDGKWITVTVDDRIPSGANGKPYFASCCDPNEWWVPIIEKAYAKLHGGYEALESGTITDALKDMTGEAVKILRIDEDPEFKDKTALWKMLVHYIKESFLMGCAIENSGARAEQENEWGLLANHAYSIIDCQEVQGHKLMRIRNPWGKGEWKGAWSDGSKEWTPALLKHFQFEFGNDGTFFMKFEDFIKFYNRVHVLCLLTDDQGEIWQKQVINGQWKGETAGGCTNHPSWPNNPQYMLTSSSANNKVFVGLSQPCLRYKNKKSPSKSGHSYEPIAIIVMKPLDQPVNCKRTTCDGRERVGKNMFMGQRDASHDFEAEKDVSYVMMPCTFNSRVEAPYELILYSQKPVKIYELSKGKK